MAMSDEAYRRVVEGLRGNSDDPMRQLERLFELVEKQTLLLGRQTESINILRDSLVSSRANTQAALDIVAGYQATSADLRATMTAHAKVCPLCRR